MCHFGTMHFTLSFHLSWLKEVRASLLLHGQLKLPRLFSSKSVLELYEFIYLCVFFFQNLLGIICTNNKHNHTLCCRYIHLEEIPTQYGGFKRENEIVFNSENGGVSEICLKPGSTETIEIQSVYPFIDWIWIVPISRNSLFFLKWWYQLSIIL